MPLSFTKTICIFIFTVSLSAISQAQVGPLLKTKWDQGCGYNALLPSSTNNTYCNKTVVGCSGVALSQIAKYWQYPNKGFGTISYLNDVTNKQITVNLDTVYFNWTKIGDSIGQVGKSDFNLQHLMKNCAYVTRSRFGPEGTAGNFTSDTIATYLGYSIMAKAMYPFPSNFDSVSTIIKKEIDNGRPVLLEINSTSGNFPHGLVIDGYKATNPIEFHLNWGWGGRDNDYFALSTIYSKSLGTDFYPMRLVYNIKPRVEKSIETKKDTLFFNSFDNYQIEAQYLSFTSYENWQLTLDNSWLNLYKSNASGVGGNKIKDLLLYPNPNLSSKRIGSVTLSNGISTKKVVVVQKGTDVAGLENASLQSQNMMQLYPNPTKDVLNVRCMLVGNNYNEYRIYNSEGVNVMNAPNEGFETSISLKGLEPGIYFLKGTGKGQRFVIE
jgi:hypothetical protein